MRILILGGTGEARELAARLTALGHEVVTSLAGRTSAPQMPAGEIRVGKFGGVPGLLGYLSAMRFDRLVDATHPYAGLISANADIAAARSGVPLVRFMRPTWSEPEGAGWVHVPDLAGAARALPSGATALVTTGHEGIEAFLARNDCKLVLRLIEQPGFPLPRHASLILARPPFTLEGETALMQREGITHLVTKNSGGTQTSAKLDAALRFGVTVIVIDRPAYGPAIETANLDDTIAALQLDT